MNTILTTIKLLEIFDGEGLNIKLNINLIFYKRIVKLFERNQINFQTITPLNPPQRFDLHFGVNTNFQDLYILIALLQNFGLQSVFLSSNKNNEICIGSYITECSPDQRRDVSQGLTVEDFLKLPFSTSIEVLINENFTSSHLKDNSSVLEFTKENEIDNEDIDDELDFYDDNDNNYSYSGNSKYYADEYYAGDIRYDRDANPWIDVFGPGDEAETAYWNTD